MTFINVNQLPAYEFFFKDISTNNNGKKPNNFIIVLKSAVLIAFSASRRLRSIFFKVVLGLLPHVKCVK